MREFQGTKSRWVSPGAFEIAPNDAANLPETVRAIRANTAGNVHCITVDGNEVTLKFAAAETRYIAIKKVFQTDTTATGLEGML